MTAHLYRDVLLDAETAINVTTFKVSHNNPNPQTSTEVWKKVFIIEVTTCY